MYRKIQVPINVDILNRKHGNDLKFCVNDCFVILQPHYKWCKLILILDPDCTTKYKWYVPQNTSFSQEYYATAKFLWTVLLISWESQALDVLCLTLHIALFHQFGIYFFSRHLVWASICGNHNKNDLSNSFRCKVQILSHKNSCTLQTYFKNLEFFGLFHQIFYKNSQHFLGKGPLLSWKYASEIEKFKILC